MVGDGWRWLRWNNCQISQPHCATEILEDVYKYSPDLSFLEGGLVLTLLLIRLILIPLTLIDTLKMAVWISGTLTPTIPYKEKEQAKVTSHDCASHHKATQTHLVTLDGLTLTVTCVSLTTITVTKQPKPGNSWGIPLWIYMGWEVIILTTTTRQPWALKILHITMYMHMHYVYAHTHNVMHTRIMWCTHA